VERAFIKEFLDMLGLGLCGWCCSFCFSIWGGAGCVKLGVNEKRVGV
jgi:hypothetical protein